MAAALAIEPVAHQVAALAARLVWVIPTRPVVLLRALSNDRKAGQLLLRDAFHLIFLHRILFLLLLLLFRRGFPLLRFPRALPPATAAIVTRGLRANLLGALPAGRLVVKHDSTRGSTWKGGDVRAEKKW